MSEAEKEARRAKKRARRKIVQAANRQLVRGATSRTPHFAARLLSDRQIHQAVQVVRHNRLVKNDVLAAAGFLPHGGKP